MKPPPRHLRAVPEPAADGDRPSPTGETVSAEGVLRAVLAAIQEPGDDVDRDTSSGASFLAMVERAGKIAPIHGDTASLAPGELLQMIGAVAAPPGARASDGTCRDTQERPAHENEVADDGGGAAEAALERLAAAAWDAIRAGGAEHAPELRTHLVEICTRLTGVAPPSPQGQ